MNTIKFDNLVEANPESKNFGKTVEIEVPDDFDENNPSFKKARDRGAAFGKRVNAVTNHLHEVESLEEVGQLGSDSAKRLHEMFKQYGVGVRNEQDGND